MKFLTAALLTLSLSFTAAAHEGHDKVPGTLTAPHGGKIKGTSQLYIELVSDTSGFKIYTLDHDLKSVAPCDVKIEGSTTIPKQKKSEKITLISSADFLETKFDAKGSHRYSVDLKVTFKGKTENVSFNVEP
jgi:hypothetical protein